MYFVYRVLHTELASPMGKIHFFRYFFFEKVGHLDTNWSGILLPSLLYCFARVAWYSLRVQQGCNLSVRSDTLQGLPVQFHWCMSA